jgi:hypothetical protein
VRFDPALRGSALPVDVPETQADPFAKAAFECVEKRRRSLACGFAHIVRGAAPDDDASAELPELMLAFGGKRGQHLVQRRSAAAGERKARNATGDLNRQPESDGLLRVEVERRERRVPGESHPPTASAIALDFHAAFAQQCDVASDRPNADAEFRRQLRHRDALTGANRSDQRVDAFASIEFSPLRPHRHSRRHGKK